MATRNYLGGAFFVLLAILVIAALDAPSGAQASCFGRTPTVFASGGETYGTAGADVIMGSTRSDVICKAVSARWQQEFPDATVIDLPDAGHYIQEDAPDTIVEAIRAEFG